MGFEVFLSLLLIVFYHLQYGDCGTTLSIKDFLSASKKSNNVDHTQAFQAAWTALCGGKANSILIQANETYTIQPQIFRGPCVSPDLYIQIDGVLEAPKTVKGWGNKTAASWLIFEGVTGLVLDGSGLLNLNGAIWWSSVAFSRRPQAVRFRNCTNLKYNGLTQRDSPRSHIAIDKCVNATLSNLRIIAPAKSPNTDGIDIALSHHIQIFDLSIETGDDCIAINGGSFDINITRVACGPGHGISVGSLGKGGGNDIVEKVNVRHCTFNGTQNGARIKTWTGGRGYAKNILYQNITVINSRLPIIIDQQYCNGQKNCRSIQDSAVKVSNVTFKDFRGTCADNIMIKLDCDQKVNCDQIVLENINITSSSPTRSLGSICRYAAVVGRSVSIDLNCGPQPPSPSPQFPPEPSPAPEVEPPSPSPQFPPEPSPAPEVEPPSPDAEPPTPDAQPPEPFARPLATYAQPPAPLAKSSSFFSFLYFF